MLRCYDARYVIFSQTCNPPEAAALLRREFFKLGMHAVPALMLSPFSDASESSDIPGADTFHNATGSAPYTLWQWINGCISKEGISADLESFRRAGISDVQQFLIGGSEADISDPENTVLGDKWLGLMRFALDECRRLGMTFGTHICPGWSASGAPGVLPEDSMQKLVWTQTAVRSDSSTVTLIPSAQVDPRWNYYQDICVIAVPANTAVVSRQQVRVISNALDDRQKLRQRLPAGDWLVLRFGHTTTGHRNETAPPSGQGLEVDKMSRQALEKFWALYPARLIAMAGDHAGTTFKRFESDSFEAGEQTWTKAMADEFSTRCGYDLLPWLPVLAGVTVGSREHAGRFKRDWQRTISALFAENYYQHLDTLIRRAGMEFLIQPYGTGHINFDIHAIRGIGTIPMCEFWWGPTTWGWDSILPVASNAHVNGKRLVAAEAFTGQPQFAWKVDPFELKTAGDRAFCGGVNLLVLHASAHQPWPDRVPGMTMGWWGTQFGPSQTWWTHGGPEWIQYLDRCQTLLQKGLFVADICFLHLTKQKDPVPPPGYKADVCNAGEFFTRFRGRDGAWHLPDGMRYRVVVLSSNFAVDDALAARILEQVEQGGVLVGNGFHAPQRLDGFPMVDGQVAPIGDLLFGQPAGNGVFARTARQVGKGRVYTGYDLQEALQLEGVAPDLAMPEGELDLLWIHRQDRGKHVYFVSNQSGKARHVRLRCRIDGLQPELWNPESGTVVDAPLWEAGQGWCDLSVQLEARGSIFIAFRRKAATPRGAFTSATFNGSTVYPFDERIVRNGKPAVRLQQPGDYALLQGADVKRKHRQASAPVRIALDTGWDVAFQAGRGAPPQVRLARLQSFTDHSLPGVKYFSGKARYRRTFELPRTVRAGGQALILDLGVVKNVATVYVNGAKVRTFWKPPFTAEIAAFCTGGTNVLEVEVTNLWPNRMIGDEHEPDDAQWGPYRYFGYVTPQAKIGRNLAAVPDWVKKRTARPSAGRVTFSTMDFFDKDDPLLPSGLLGPVVITVEDILLP